jgi:hypothetical protein
MTIPIEKYEMSVKTNIVEQFELIRHCNPIAGIYNPDKCSECGNTTFILKIDSTYCGIIYCCTQCGYVHTYWFET